jgi:SLT domain-containing protein
MAVSILADLAQIAFRKSVTEPLIEGMFGGGSSGGGLLSSLFGGARAGGGDVDPGKFYLVGEKGPELVVPRGAGTVIPNDKLGGGVNVTVNQTIDARGAYPESIEEIKRAVAQSNASMPQVAIAAVREATGRGAM